MRRPIDLETMFARFSEHFSPKVVARRNDHEIRLVKDKGAFVWHAHEAVELFPVTRGTLVVQLRDGAVLVDPGQMFVVPAGVEHRPWADEAVHVVLVDVAGEPNTGDAPGERSADVDDGP
jgi:mannose-6-phosphate isomerase-like protein (cupin superfamily)